MQLLLLYYHRCVQLVLPAAWITPPPHLLSLVTSTPQSAWISSTLHLISLVSSTPHSAWISSTPHLLVDEGAYNRREFERRREVELQVLVNRALALVHA